MSKLTPSELDWISQTIKNERQKYFEYLNKYGFENSFAHCLDFVRNNILVISMKQYGVKYDYQLAEKLSGLKPEQLDL